MCAIYTLQVTQHTASGPKTTARPLAVIEERPDAVRTADGWIDRAFVTEVPLHSCDETCQTCWRCFQSADLLVCRHLCAHREED